MEDIDMASAPSYFEPEDLSIRERFRRYGKRYSTSSPSPQQDSGASRLDEIRSNAALFLEDIKQVESLDNDHGGTSSKSRSASKKRPSIDGHESEFGGHSVRVGTHLVKACKQEEEILMDDGDTTFSLFASLLDSALQGLMPIPDLILRFESACRDVSESIRFIAYSEQTFFCLDVITQHSG